MHTVTQSPTMTADTAAVTTEPPAIRPALNR